MRILIVTGLFPNRVAPHRGVYVLRQALALKRRAEVMVVSPVPYFPRFFRYEKYAGFSQLPDMDLIEGIRVIYPRYVIVPKVLRFHHGVSATLSLSRPFRRVTREFRPDIVVGYFAYPYGYAAVVLAKSLGVPVITAVLGSDVNFLGRKGLRRRMIKHCLKNSDKVFSVSEALKERVVAMGVPGDRVIVIPNGVDVELYGRCSRSVARERLDLPSSARIVLCVANLVYVKGVDLVIQAFGELEDEANILVLVGKGEEQRRLEKMVCDLGLAERIRFVGARPPDEVPLWMTAADLVVLGSRAEGHPNVILEAMASGRPVVATRVGGVSEAIRSGEVGLISEAGNVTSLAEAMRTALSRTWDEDAIRRVGHGRTWDHVAEEIIAEVQSILTKQREEQLEPC
jgi:teichuronic acid biosynthesis glycosyltransferase TuaC